LPKKENGGTNNLLFHSRYNKGTNVYLINA